MQQARTGHTGHSRFGRPLGTKPPGRNETCSGTAASLLLTMDCHMPAPYIRSLLGCRGLWAVGRVGDRQGTDFLWGTLNLRQQAGRSSGPGFLVLPLRDQAFDLEGSSHPCSPIWAPHHYSINHTDGLSPSYGPFSTPSWGTSNTPTSGCAAWPLR